MSFTLEEMTRLMREITSMNLVSRLLRSRNTILATQSVVRLVSLVITRQKTRHFSSSQEWRRDLVPGQVFHVPVPSDAERGVNTPGFGDFSDVCPGDDCPNVPDPTAVPIDPNAQAILAQIPQSNADVSVCGGAPFVGCFNASPANKTTWREELVRVDHNFSPKIRAMFRYIHDSWQTTTPTTLWGCPDGCSFPTIQTGFVGPGTSTVLRLTSTAITNTSERICL